MQRAAEALVVEHGERVEADARFVVELPTVGDVAAPQRALRLLTVETGVNSWGGVSEGGEVKNTLTKQTKIRSSESKCSNLAPEVAVKQRK